MNYLQLIKRLKIFVSVFLLGITFNSFAANPPLVEFSLLNEGAYYAGLFYNKPHEQSFTQVKSWIAGPHSDRRIVSPSLPKGSVFCVSVVGFPGFEYFNYYFDTNHDSPDWFHNNVGKDGVHFYGNVYETHFLPLGDATGGVRYIRSFNTMTPCPYIDFDLTPS